MKPVNAIRRRLLKGAVALPATAIGGCVVTPYGPYYRPASSHPGARYKGAWCQGVAGPLAVIEMPLAPGVTFTARAERGYIERDRPDLPLRMAFAIPAAQPFRFAGPLTIAESRTGRPIGGQPKVHVFRYAALAPGAWVDAHRLRPSGSAGTPSKADAPYGSASVRVSFDAGFTPERMQVEGLVLEHDRGPIRMPAVTMARPASKASTRDYRSAGLHAQLEREADACRRKTPKSACDNIVEHSSISFLTEDSDARWSGRWFVFGDGSGARIEGDISVEPRRPGRWRTTTDTIVVRDSSGEARQGRFARLHVALNDHIALDTPLFAAAVDGSGDAQLSIEVSLPAGAPDFTVALPELLLGTERVSVPPIRFDRRTFDGGIEPFNC